MKPLGMTTLKHASKSLLLNACFQLYQLRHQSDQMHRSSVNASKVFTRKTKHKITSINIVDVYEPLEEGIMIIGIEKIGHQEELDKLEEVVLEKLILQILKIFIRSKIFTIINKIKDYVRI